MSTYALVLRGVVQAVAADASGIEFTLPSSVKSGSSFRVTNQREVRRQARVIRGAIAITDADMGNTKSSAAFGAAVDMNCTEVRLLGFRESRDPTGLDHGVTVKLLDSTHVQATWGGTLGSGETVDVEYEAVELKQPVGATLRLSAVNKLKMEWDGGALATGETITFSYEVWDYSVAGDDIKELLFRAQRVLAHLGENMMMDLVNYDDPGNRRTWRIRVFDTQANLNNATPNSSEGGALVTGELARYKATKTIDDQGENEATLLILERTHLKATPGIG